MLSVFLRIGDVVITEGHHAIPELRKELQTQNGACLSCRPSPTFSGMGKNWRSSPHLFSHTIPNTSYIPHTRGLSCEHSGPCLNSIPPPFGLITPGISKVLKEGESPGVDIPHWPHAVEWTQVSTGSWDSIHCFLTPLSGHWTGSWKSAIVCRNVYTVETSRHFNLQNSFFPGELVYQCTTGPRMPPARHRGTARLESSKAVVLRFCYILESPESSGVGCQHV